jgi:hypothetical protein
MSEEFQDDVLPKMTGHVLIRDPESGQVILDKKNAIHYENMSLAIGYALANKGEGIIYSMAFGNGGSAVSGTGAITYFPTNTVDPKADLYDPTYNKIIDASSTNFIEVKHLLGTPYTDIVVTCTLDYNEPSGQEAFDDASHTDGTYVFDELGLKTSEGLLLTHVVFNPIQKALNRLIEVVYTLRVQMN